MSHHLRKSLRDVSINPRTNPFWRRGDVGAMQNDQGSNHQRGGFSFSDVFVSDKHGRILSFISNRRRIQTSEYTTIYLSSIRKLVFVSLFADDLLESDRCHSNIQSISRGRLRTADDHRQLHRQDPSTERTSSHSVGSLNLVVGDLLFLESTD